MHASGWAARPAFVLLAVLLLGGCAGSSSHMRDVAPEQANYQPAADKALVVFMRPSGLGWAVQSTVFDVSGDAPQMVGVVSAKTKVAYDVAPGEHHFMVVGEAADFMGATLTAGKTYYALVTPRMGAWKARFSLRPVSKSETRGDQFRKWYDACRWVENTPASAQWYADNRVGILEKLSKYWGVWQAKPDKPILFATDGT